MEVSAGSDIYRLLSFFDGSSMVVQAHGFHKKSQKIPQREVRVAEERRRDYFTRKGKK